MAGPDCGCSVGELRFAHSTHGLDCGPYETYYEEFVICRNCDGRFDVAEWSAAEPNLDLASPNDMIQVAFDAEDHAASGAWTATFDWGRPLIVELHPGFVVFRLKRTRSPIFVTVRL